METLANIAVAIFLIPAIGLCCTVFVRWIYPMRIEFEDEDEDEDEGLHDFRRKIPKGSVHD